MPYIAVNNKTVVCVAPKAASHSIYQALNTVPHKHITVAQALEYENRVAWIRDPIERMKSNFNHFWALNNAGHVVSAIPRDLFKCFSQRVNGLVQTNKHHQQFDKEWALEKVQSKHAAFYDNEDYERFVDYILDLKPSDDHFGVQMVLYSQNNVMIPNKFYLFEIISKTWLDWVGGVRLPWTNSWSNIAVDDGYRIDDLNEYYAADKAKRRVLMG